MRSETNGHFTPAGRCGGLAYRHPALSVDGRGIGALGSGDRAREYARLVEDGGRVRGDEGLLEREGGGAVRLAVRRALSTLCDVDAAAADAPAIHAGTACGCVV